MQYEIHLWDCGGEFFQMNKFLRKAFFRNSSATFLVFDLCDPKWRESIPQWIEEAHNCEAFLLYLIGTKKDLF
jgi:GTPase SAR1 family protein